MATQKLWSVIFISLSLIGCGGGSSTNSVPTGGAPATVSINGVAIDGNLYQAKAFLDLNGNGVYDVGEPTATTGPDGAFTLQATQDQINSHSVVVAAIAGTTIDQDTPNTPLVAGFTMMAPAGNPNVVSPLTTQVAAKMAEGLSLEAAKSAVQTQLQLTSVDVMQNYVALQGTVSAYSDAHKVAASVAEILKNIESQFSANTTVANRLASLAASVTTNVVPSILQVKAAPSVNDVKAVVTNAILQSNTYSISGSVSGLFTGQQITISNGGVDQILSANSGFQLTTKIPYGGSFAISITQRPVGDTCIINNGSSTGGVTANLSNVSIQCGKNVCIAAQAVIQDGGGISADQMHQLEIDWAIYQNVNNNNRLRQSFIQQNLDAARAVIAQQC